MVEAALATGWQAQLTLGFAARGTKTVLATRQQRGPLAIQRPFYPEGDVCHAYVLHPPGGVVGGDQLQINLDVQATAHALLTTPGATKFYRSAGAQAQQHQHFSVINACLEWLPQENIFFPGANAALHSTIHLHHQARYIGWEIHCLGRPVNEERFAHGRALFHTALYRDNQPLLFDRLLVADEQHLHSAAGLRSHPVIATLLATPATPAVLELARELCADVSGMGQAGATLLNGVLVVRYLGNSTAQAHRLFRQLWQAIRPLVAERPAVTPRIWNT